MNFAQGGANNGEDLRKAAMRELREETGVIYIPNVNRNVVCNLCYEVTIIYVTAGIFQLNGLVVIIDNYEVVVPEKDEKALMKVVANQPVTIVIDAGGKDFQFYLEIKQAGNVRKRLSLPSISGHLTATTIPTAKAAFVSDNLPSEQPIDTPPQPHLQNPMISFAPSKPIEEDKKAAAAAVVAKLAASTSFAQMLSSVLSSLAIEEANTSLNGSLSSSGHLVLDFMAKSIDDFLHCC
ncbi:hypothetical protein PTKIN_Ptkin14bG0100000 [Pterospermum kingtungense]